MRIFPLNKFRIVIATVAITLFGGLASTSGVSAQITSHCNCQVPVGTSGVVQGVVGNVFVSQAGGSSPAQTGMRLGAGDVIQVGPQSSSVIVFDGCKLDLHANTSFRVFSQGEQLCLAVNGNAAEAGTFAKGGVMSVPAGIAASIGLGAVVLSVSDTGKSVSR